MKQLLGLIAGLFFFGVTGIANAAFVTYEINFSADWGHTGGFGTIVADITGDPVTSSIVSVEAHVDGITYANHYNSAGRLVFSETDLEEFYFFIGEGTTAHQEDIFGNPTMRQGFPALNINTEYYTYANFESSRWSSDTFAKFDINRRSAPAPVPVPAAAWLLGSGLVGLGGVRRKFMK